MERQVAIEKAWQEKIEQKAHIKVIEGFTVANLG
jgi:hypothetical protein